MDYHILLATKLTANTIFCCVFSEQILQKLIE